MVQNWNDLQFFLAIYEAESLIGASKRLKVDETTVGRRLSALESQLGSKLFVRNKNGFILTVSGQQVLETAWPVQKQLRKLGTQLEGKDQSLKGLIKITMPETFATYIALPRLPELFAAHPQLEVEFIASAQTVNVSKREADIAVRMFKPKTGALFATRVGKLRFAFYTAKNRPQQQQKFIDYPESESTAVEARMMQAMRKKYKSSVRVNNRYSLLSAIRAGLGFGLIPEIMLPKDHDLQLVPNLEPIDLETWLVVNDDLKTNARVRVTRDFLKSIFSEQLR